MKKTIFEYDDRIGAINILREGFMLKIEIWWKGRAPWGYHNVFLARNLQFDSNGSHLPFTHCDMSDEECAKAHKLDGEISGRSCNLTGYWRADRGHLVCLVPTVIIIFHIYIYVRISNSIILP